MYNQQAVKKDLFRESNRIGIALLLCVALQSGLSALLYGLISVVAGKGFSTAPVGGYTLAYEFASTLTYVVSFAAAIWFLSDDEPWALTRPKKPFGWMSIPIFFTTLLGVNIVTAVLQQLWGYIGIRGFESVTVFPENAGEIAVFLLKYLLFPPILEELLFRGLILGRLRRFGDDFAVFFSALLFAAMHNNLVTFGGILLLGAVFGYVTVASGSLVPAIVMHLLNNGLAVFSIFAAEHLDAVVLERFNSIVVMMGITSAVLLALSYILNYRGLRDLATDADRDAPAPPKGRARIMLSLPMIAFFLAMIAATVQLEILWNH